MKIFHRMRHVVLRHCTFFVILLLPQVLTSPGHAIEVYKCSCWDGVGPHALCMARGPVSFNTFDDITGTALLGIPALGHCSAWCNGPPPNDRSGYKGPRYPYADITNYNKCTGLNQYPGGDYK
jgi:hypothetical protein